MKGAEKLRRAVALFNNCREDFNDRYSAQELLRLYDAYSRSDWDVPPDRWTAGELYEALQGTGTGARGDTLCSNCRNARPADNHTPLCDSCEVID